MLFTLTASMRAANLETVKLLLEEYHIDKNLLTDAGISPLRVARYFLKEDPVTKYLESIGALDIHQSADEEEDEEEEDEEEEEL